MGCTISTCNFTQPVTNKNEFNDLNELDLPINRGKTNQKIPHYKRQNSLTIDTSWGKNINIKTT